MCILFLEMNTKHNITIKVNIIFSVIYNATFLPVHYSPNTYTQVAQVTVELHYSCAEPRTPQAVFLTSWPGWTCNLSLEITPEALRQYTRCVPALLSTALSARQGRHTK